MLLLLSKIQMIDMKAFATIKLYEQTWVNSGYKCATTRMKCELLVAVDAAVIGVETPEARVIVGVAGVGGWVCTWCVCVFVLGAEWSVCEVECVKVCKVCGVNKCVVKCA